MVSLRTRDRRVKVWVGVCEATWWGSRGLAQDPSRSLTVVFVFNCEYSPSSSYTSRDYPHLPQQTNAVAVSRPSGVHHGVDVLERCGCRLTPRPRPRCGVARSTTGRRGPRVAASSRSRFDSRPRIMTMRRWSKAARALAGCAAKASTARARAVGGPLHGSCELGTGLGSGLIGNGEGSGCGSTARPGCGGGGARPRLWARAAAAPRPRARHGFMWRSSKLAWAEAPFSISLLSQQSTSRMGRLHSPIGVEGRFAICIRCVRVRG